MRSSWLTRRCARSHRPMVYLVASAVAAAALYASLLTAGASASPGSSPGGTPALACSSLTGLSLPGLPGSDTATVSATEVAGSGCQVAIEITDTSDPRGGQPGMIGIDLTLPDSWNGNYMAEGGGVYCGPASFVTLAGDQWLAAGYAISQDDCGHTGYTNALISPWVINQTQSTDPSPLGLNWSRIDDFGYLAHHLMAVESKFVINRYYASRAQYSFWNGCSTGGRQGLSEAEKYPTDFNGVLAGAPALNWDQFMVAQMWPQLVMEWNNDELSPCKENLVNTTLQAKCRDQDGQVDGVFDPRTCDVIGILKSLIGTSTPCGTFTATDALVIQEIWQGPRLSGSQSNLKTGLPVWFGLEPGANLSGAYLPFLGPGGGLGLATTFQLPSGQYTGAPFIPSDDWFQNWIKQDPSWVYQDETYQQYWQDFLTSGRRFDYAMAADNPNLSAFRRAGGKLIMWQGLADQLIFTGDSINFYNQAIFANGGLNSTQQFWRYFAVPGVAHCGTPGPGSVAPTNPMQQVIDWVEHGQAPAVLNASGTINGQSVTRPICPYPDPDAVYTGGDPNQASSYTCRNTVQLDNPFQPGPAGNEPPREGSHHRHWGDGQGDRPFKART
ncbi:MAG: tannase/feruloyl esterase family alpha/beta hydrolase [Solirubrobacterales bacterium]|nr:tannase/feruloyl esterase family alpha/beta hydrolase [Solirubrobacterales bacterium]